MQSFHSIWHHTNKGEPYWMDMERVIGAALAGDQKAIARLYNAYSHKVLGICVNIVGNRAVAEELAFKPKQATVAGIPLEKLIPRHQVIEHLCRHDAFSLIFANNSIYTQGFYQEIINFVNAVEGRRTNVLTDLQSVRATMQLIEKIKGR